MRVIVVLGALVAALAIAPAASPGGWATVGFDPLPDGVSAGGAWTPTIYIKQHGVTPLTGLQPVVEIYVEGRGDSGLEQAIAEIADFEFVLVPDSQPAEAHASDRDAKE